MRTLVFVMTICLLVVACGTKGPLYLPERKYPQETPTN